MNVITIGDLHFKPENANENDTMTKEIIEIIKNIKPRFTVILGDTLHTNERINMHSFIRATNFFENIKNICDLFIIIGNHDRPNEDDSKYLPEHHAFNALKEWKNTFIIDEPLAKHIDDLYFLFVPYVSKGNFIEKIGKIEKYNAVFCHQEFHGARLKNIKSADGDKWPLNYPLVISGHIHTYHMPQQNIIYVGSPSEGDTRFITLFKFTENDYNYERIRLNYYKSKNKILITSDNIDNIDKKMLNNEISDITIQGSSSEEIKMLEKRIRSINKNLICKKKHLRKNKIIDCNKPFIDKVKEEIADEHELLELLNKIINKKD